MFGADLIYVIITEMCLDNVQYRKPRTKKKRIQKKWSRNKKNFKKVPATNLRIIGANKNQLIAVGHPTIKERLDGLNEKAGPGSPRFEFVNSLEEVPW